MGSDTLITPTLNEFDSNHFVVKMQDYFLLTRVIKNKI